MSDTQSSSAPSLKVIFNQGSLVPSTDNKKRKDGLRKGKWTAEEEKFANKIIEVFNAGLLKLQEEEKGITLRAYLAAKLDCDPMRITKKYTGASCLGKKVYHFDPKSTHAQEADFARRELELLERQFKTKLDQMNRKKSHDHSNALESSRMVSTPAIDALVLKAKPTTVPPTNAMLQLPGQPVPNIPSLPLSTMNASVAPYYPTGFNPQGLPPHPYYPPYSNMPYYQPQQLPFFPTDNGNSSAPANPAAFQSSADASQYSAMLNDYLRYQQLYHQAYPYIGGMANNPGYGHFMAPMSFHSNPAMIQAASTPPSDNQNSASPVAEKTSTETPSTLQTDESVLKRRSIEEIQSIDGETTLAASLENNDNPAKRQRFEESIHHHHPNSMTAASVGKTTAPTATTATSSLMGFINHLQKISSQENLLDFFDPSKSLSSGASTLNADHNQTSPSKLASRESVESLVKLLSPRIVIGQL